jgi:hypothetical protein
MRVANINVHGNFRPLLEFYTITVRTRTLTAHENDTRAITHRVTVNCLCSDFDNLANCKRSSIQHAQNYSMIHLCHLKWYRGVNSNFLTQASVTTDENSGKISQSSMICELSSDVSEYSMDLQRSFNTPCFRSRWCPSDGTAHRKIMHSLTLSSIKDSVPRIPITRSLIGGGMSMGWVVKSTLANPGIVHVADRLRENSANPMPAT